jgi:glycosyltransferase involved in cell wall biosynthesis
LIQSFRFWRLITKLKYDRVFVHMAPLYGALGAAYWPLKKIPVYLWYTHWPMSVSLRIVTRFAKRFFCAGFTSLPGFEGDARKIVTGHGIDLSFWTRQKNYAQDPYALLTVNRLCRSKHIDTTIRALTLLPERYTLTVHGAELEKDYVAELHTLVKELALTHRVTFKPPLSMHQLRATYPQYKYFVNMAHETLDKTMVECLSSGMWLVTSPRNAQSIGLSKAPKGDTPDAVAKFIEESIHWTIDVEKTYQVLAQKHDLAQTIEKMDAYISQGI